MFFKYVALLSFTTSAIAGVIIPGIYRLVNVAASDSSARVACGTAPVHVNRKEVVGALELVSPSLGHLSLNVL
jgi:hypothetical protein